MIHIYCYHSLKSIIISDRPSDKVKAKFGHRYEILTSIRERDSVAVVLPRVMRNYPGFQTIEWYAVVRKPISDEARARMIASKIGKPRPASSNAKTSATMKGRSNFRGKKHRDESKDAIAAKMLGNDNSAGLIWCHDPVTGEETRVADWTMIPSGWIAGRDYYAIEPLLLSRR
jgi:hypothetical protein